MRTLTRAVGGWLLLGAFLGTAASHAVDVRDLPERYRAWLIEVAVLITSEERKEFLAIEKDYQRDAFIARFWKSRDPYPETARNELKLRWDERVEAARERYGNLEEDRARLLLLHGEPEWTLKTDCGLLLWPIEVWRYPSLPGLSREFYFLFLQRNAAGRYLRWSPKEGYQALQSLAGEKTPVPEALEGQRRQQPGYVRQPLGPSPADRHLPDELRALLYRLQQGCPDFRELRQALLEIRDQDEQGLDQVADRRPRVEDPEWLATFQAVSTEVAAEAAPLPARLAIAFTGREDSRTVVAGTLSVPAAAAGVAELAGVRSYNFLLTGEVLRKSADEQAEEGERELLESFRYRFDVPATAVAGSTEAGGAPAAPAADIPLAFERLLRAGEITLVLKLEDLNSGHAVRLEQPLAVPAEVETATAAGSPGAEPPASGPLAEAYQALSGGPELHLVMPEQDVYVGGVRVAADVAGEGIRRVAFFLDDQPLLTKSRPPFGVELSLGPVPRTRKVRAVAYDEAGRELASDERVLNEGSQPFTVRLVEPRRGRRMAGGALKARAEVHLPEGARLDRLEIYLDEARVATLYQPPWVQTVSLPKDGALAYVRAVASLTDGATTEDLVLVNAPEGGEEIDVQLVEVYAAVTDRAGRPVADLKREEVAVLEDGVAQKVLRFERVAEIPLHLVLVVDTSASMAEILPQVKKAGAELLRSTLTPRDRAAVVTFSDSPIVAAPFTQDVVSLAGSLAGLHAERSTALYDCIVFALQYIKGARGQSALLVISDGGDRASRFSAEDTLELARRSGVTIYTLGIGLKRLDLEGRPRLTRLAEETGGRAYFRDPDDDLAPLWAALGEELRTRWLIAYQSSATGNAKQFRKVELRVSRPGVEVQALRGYYPK